MGYSKTDMADIQSCEELKADVREWVKTHKSGTLGLSLYSKVQEGTIRRWLDGETDLLHIVAYARLWLTVHPEEE